MRQTMKKVDNRRDVVEIEDEDHDPVQNAFLEFLANDIASGNRVMELPPAVITYLRSLDAGDIDVNEAIEGHVDL